MAAQLARFEGIKENKQDQHIISFHEEMADCCHSNLCIFGTREEPQIPLHQAALTLIGLSRSTATGNSLRVDPCVHESPMQHADHGGGGALHNYDWMTPVRQGSTLAALPSVVARGRVDDAIAACHNSPNQW